MGFVLRIVAAYAVLAGSLAFAADSELVLLGAKQPARAALNVVLGERLFIVQKATFGEAD